MTCDPRLRLRLQYEAGSRLGPGKVDLLEAIADTGSISAAGRALGMSYTRAWALVDQMNDSFVDPLVSSARGGARGGGAQLTETGLSVLGHYRALEAAARAAGAPHIAAITALRRPVNDA
jgi:molybdate transport system regulatory protein